MDPVDPRVFVALEEITRVLDDPSREVPQLCVMVLLGLLNEGLPKCIKPQSHDVEQQLDRFRTCAYRWICAPRSPTLWARVFNWACTGPGCLERAAPLHKLGRRVFADVGVESSACLFLLYLSAGLKRPFLSERKMGLGRITRRSAWPTRVEQILPYGDSTMLGLLSWLEADWATTASESLVANIHILAKMTRPMTLHHLLDSPAFIPKGILPLLQSACDLLSGSKRPGPLSPNSRERSKPSNG